MICWRCLHYYTKQTGKYYNVKRLKQKQLGCPKCGCFVFVGKS